MQGRAGVDWLMFLDSRDVMEVLFPILLIFLCWGSDQ